MYSAVSHLQPVALQEVLVNDSQQGVELCTWIARLV